jgi:hypothetical protein
MGCAASAGDAATPKSFSGTQEIVTGKKAEKSAVQQS